MGEVLIQWFCDVRAEKPVRFAEIDGEACACINDLHALGLFGAKTLEELADVLEENDDGVSARIRSVGGAVQEVVTFYRIAIVQELEGLPRPLAVFLDNAVAALGVEMSLGVLDPVLDRLRIGRTIGRGARRKGETEGGAGH